MLCQLWENFRVTAKQSLSRLLPSLTKHSTVAIDVLVLNISIVHLVYQFDKIQARQVC